jgi:hypothetical protein
MDYAAPPRPTPWRRGVGGFTNPGLRWGPTRILLISIGRIWICGQVTGTPTLHQVQCDDPFIGKGMRHAACHAPSLRTRRPVAKSRASELNRERAMRGAYANKSLSRTPLEELIGPTGPITTREELKPTTFCFFPFFIFSLSLSSHLPLDYKRGDTTPTWERQLTSTHKIFAHTRDLRALPFSHVCSPVLQTSVG